MFCTKCGTAIQGNFCPNCGALAGLPQQPAGTPGPTVAAFPPPSGYTVRSTADIGTRILAVLIDALPIICLSLVIGRVPVVGGMVMGFISAAYWLLRDFNGASLGKTLLGLAVVKKDGTPAPTSDLILRNVTLAIGPATRIIPFLGFFIFLPIALVLACAEIVVLVTRHERIGDMLAGTMVIRKPV